MAKPVRKQPIPAKKQASIAIPAVDADLQLPAFFKNIQVPSLIIFGFAFLLYANTLTHGFVLDDAIVITDNMYTQKGVEGIPGILSKDTFFGFFKVEGKEELVSGGRYRPFTLVLFAFLYQLAGSSPFVFHLLTVSLFALTCVVLFRTMQTLLSPRLGAGYGTMLSWLAAVLFAAHPIHTEVVDNIKGCDEIVTLLLSLLSLWLVLKAYDSGKTGLAWAAAGVFFLACLSKENAAAFVLIIPLALWFFRPGMASESRSVWRYSAPVWLGFAAFFLLRGTILHWKFGAAPMEFMNNPFLKIEGDHWVAFSFAEKMATVLYTLGKYVALLIFPHPLTHDYYPRQIPMMSFGSPLVLLSLALYLGMAWYALSGMTKKDPIRFGILFYLLSLSIVSNVVFPIGTNMGERFAFMPSVGFCLVAAALLLQLVRSAKGWQSEKLNTVLVVSGIIVALFSLKTVMRNPAWASNEKLFFTDAKTSTNSAKIQNAMGGILFEKAKAQKEGPERDALFQESLSYADKALKIYGNYKDALLTRGGAKFYLRQYDAAVADYRQVLQIASNDPKIPAYLALALREAGKNAGEKENNLPKALNYLNESWTINNQDAGTARLLGVAFGVQGNMAAMQKQPAQAAQFNAQALDWFKKAAALAPNDASIQYDLGTAYYMVGDPAQAQACHQKAFELDPKLKAQKGGK